MQSHSEVGFKIGSPNSHLPRGGVIVLSKMRLWLVRDEIVSLLNSCKAQSTWVSAAMLALNRVIQIESKELKQGDLIPAVARVQCIDVKMILDGPEVQLSYGKSQHAECRKCGHLIWKSESLSY